jgi:hypothetical protein
VHNLFDSSNIAVASTGHGHEPQQTQATALAKRAPLHSYGDGKLASEGVEIGMVLGSADAHGWMSVGHYFL